MSYLPQVQTISFSTPMSGVVDVAFPLAGTLRPVALGETADYTTDFAVSNQHAYIYVNSITTGGDIVITGTSLSESTAIPVPGDTETITIDTTAAQYYQSDKKWWEITNIDISSGTIVALDYDIGIVGYPDFANRDFKLLGYRLDAYSQNTNADFRFIMEKVQDDGGKKMSLITLEDIGVDSGGAVDIDDQLRTGGDDRSYITALGQIWENNSMLTFKQGDFESYFTSNENHFLGENKNEGILIRFAGSPSGGISNVDFVTTILYFKPLL